MIVLTKLGRDEERYVLNSELIETIEEKPDTIIRLVNGKHFIVAESAGDVVKKIVAYKRRIHR
ncbi:MAG: flagellar FlbD family protein [Anaerovoracaceae bacterium]